MEFVKKLILFGGLTITTMVGIMVITDYAFENVWNLYENRKEKKSKKKEAET